MKIEKEKKIRVSITIGSKLHDKAQEYAFKIDSNFSRLISELLRKQLSHVVKQQIDDTF